MMSDNKLLIVVVVLEFIAIATVFQAIRQLLNITTLFLGRLTLSKRLTNTECTPATDKLS